MPIFYNTAAPTPSTNNTINSVTVDYGIRDFLLNLNLGPFYPDFSSTAVNGSPQIGQPVLDTSINGNANVVPFGLPLEQYGLFYYEMSTIQNQFQNNDGTAPTLLSIENIPTTQGVFGNVDLPQGSSYPTSATDAITENGLLGKTEYAEFRKTATLFNLYVDSTKQIDMADFISLQPAGYPQQLTNYVDQFGRLDNGGPSTNDLNVVGSILNGQGLGLARAGTIPNFDFRASIAGRTLTGFGVGNDTRLGIIGGEQLALALANNAAFNVQQDILGGLNVQDNILALVKGGPLPGLRPNYKITVPETGLGRLFDYTSSVLGFTVPRSYLEDAGSIFLSESDSPNIERANAMILNTGKGQVEALIANVFANVNGTTPSDNPDITRLRSGYVPGYKNNKGDKAIDANLYGFYNSDGETIYNFITSGTDLIPEISYNRPNMIKEYGFKSPEDTLNALVTNDSAKVVPFSWHSNNGDSLNAIRNSNVLKDDEFFEGRGITIVGHPKKSLLSKTQKLFNSKGMLNIVTVKGDMNDKQNTQLERANGYGISKGSAVLRGDRFSDGLFDGQKKDAENTYCRSWTTLDRYDQVNNLIRSRGLYDNTSVPYRYQVDGSVLDDNGFVKITPYNRAKGEVENPKRYMLSLENLAWSDYVNDLPPYEKGNGDPLNPENKGRIMWFPPYDIQFNESSSVNWETNNFIGRGEPIYTYNNTERSGTLSFKIIVDHPTYVNSFGKGNGTPDDNYVASFFAGCVEADPKFTERLTVSEFSETVSRAITEIQSQVLESQTPPSKFDIYYPNDSPSLDPIINGVDNKGIIVKYEVGLSGSTPTPIDYSQNSTGQGLGIGSFVGGGTSQTPWDDEANYGLNGFKQTFTVGTQTFSGLTDSGFMPALKKYLNTECTYCRVNITSYASPHGNQTDNKTLATDRTKNVAKYFKDQLNLPDNRIYSGENKPILENETKCRRDGEGSRSTEACKRDRKTQVIFEYLSSLAEADLKNAPTPVVVANENVTINTKITNRFYNESNWFEKLIKGNREKNIPGDYFVFDKFREKIKYFHPAFHSTTPEGLNSRLTFLHQCTRQGATLEAENANNLAFGRAPVCILRVGDFYHTKIVIDNLSIDYEPLVWDLNPEGIGVQPMIANVTLSFKFLGGSSLAGPINKLQNALSFNYYANAHVYDVRADYVRQGQLKEGLTNLSGAVEVLTASVVERTPVENQIAANDNVNSGPVNEPSVAPSGSTEPKITGFKYIRPEYTSGETMFEIYIQLKQENIYSGETLLITEEALNDFLSKKIRISIDTYGPFIITKYNQIIDDFMVIQMLSNVGRLSYEEPRFVKLEAGSYIISVYYDDNKIQSQNIDLKELDNKEYSY
jgi:hypothetical protein